VTKPHDFDNTWGIAKNSGLVPSAFSLFLYLFVQVFNVVCFFLLQLAFVTLNRRAGGFHPSGAWDSHRWAEVQGLDHPWHIAHLLRWSCVDAYSSQIKHLLLTM